MKLLLKILTAPFVGLYLFLKFILKVSWESAVRHVKDVNEQTAADALEANGVLDPNSPTQAKSAWIRYPTRVFLWMYSPIVLVIFPTLIVGAIVFILVGIDQLTAPSFPVSKELAHIDSTPDDKKDPTMTDIGTALLLATAHQMEVELSTPYLIGWTPNDMFGGQWFDNRVNRQLGVRHAAIVMLLELQNITNYGDNDKVDPRIVSAYQGGFTFDPYVWMMPGWSESAYEEGIENIKSFVKDARAGKPGVVINITNEDIHDIFFAVDEALRVPQGELIESSSLISWNKSDDEIFFAKGAAIVARDILVVMRQGYEKDIRARGALDNLDQAIVALEKVLAFQPSIVWAIGDDSQFPDHRANLSQYLQDIRSRMDNLQKAYNN